jgi:O-antigen/teichoic acid export membrane protein
VSRGLFGFLLVVVITRGLPPGTAGLFFEAVALFMILARVCGVGAEDGLVRMVARYQALGRVRDIRRILTIALVPVLALGIVGGILLFAFAPELSSIVVHGSPSERNDLVPYLRTVAPFLPLVAVSGAMLAATRGFGTMVPTVAVDSFGNPATRAGLAFVVIAAGMGSVAVAMSWAAPAALGSAAAMLWLVALVRGAERGAEAPFEPSHARRTLGGEFWRFAAPRGLSGIFGIMVAWLDSLFIGTIRGPEETAVYVAAARYMTLGLFALAAIQAAIGPLVSRSLATGNRGHAQFLYQTATQWLIAASWPIFLTLAVFAPLFLRVFGPDYEAGHTALIILALAMLANMAAGPVLIVLLMGGRSGWTLAVAAGGLVLNVVLNLILIPGLGVDGAALAWAATIVFNNALGVVLVARLLNLSPFGRGALTAALVASLCYGLGGLAVRFSLGLSLGSLALFAILSTTLYGVVLWRIRASLNLGVLGRALKPRNGLPPQAAIR